MLQRKADMNALPESWYLWRAVDLHNQAKQTDRRNPLVS
jgi:hypothetical protein